MKNIHPSSEHLDLKRFETHHLNQIFKEFKSNSGENGSFDSIDSQAFKNIMMLAIRQGRVPNLWKYMNFEQISLICQNFSDYPLPAISFGGEGPTQYKGNQEVKTPDRQWIRWKLIMTGLILLNTSVPNEEAL